MLQNQNCKIEIPYNCAATLDIVCPHCGYKHQDGWDMPIENDEHECAECFKKFGYSSEPTVYYTSWKDNEKS